MRYYAWFRPQMHTFDYARRAVKAGVSGFEAVYWESYLSPEVHKEYLETVRRVKDELGVGFTVHAPIKDIHLGSLNRKLRQVAFDEIKSSLELANSIGASLVVVHGAPGLVTMPGGEWSKQVNLHPSRKQGEVAEQEGYLVRALKDLADFAPDILLGVENLVFPHELYRSPEELKELLRKINRSNVGLTLDVGHAVVSGYRAAEFVNLLARDLFHVHLHDNHGVIDEHLPLGQGSIDYVAIIQALKKLDYQGVVTLEFPVSNPDDFGQYVLEIK